MHKQTKLALQSEQIVWNDSTLRLSIERGRAERLKFEYLTPNLIREGPR